MTTNRAKTIWILLMLGVVALTIRILAAREAYPCVGDVGHFAQHGLALAHGIPNSMSTYWSQGMIGVVALAETWHVDFRLVLQCVSIFAGTLVVILLAGIVIRLVGSLWVGLLAGLLCATNSTFVHYSIVGYSESAYLAIMLLGIYAGMSLVRPSVRLSLTRSLCTAFSSGACIGLSGYFKGLDAAVAAFSFALFVTYIAIKQTRQWFPRHGLVILGSAFLAMLPLCVFTFQQTGSFTPGSKGASNMKLGLDWKDSKVVYSASSSKTEIPYIQVLKETPARVIKNTADIFRIINSQLFIKGFRIGTFWFFAMCLLGVALLFYGSREYLILPGCMLFVQL